MVASSNALAPLPGRTWRAPRIALPLLLACAACLPARGADAPAPAAGAADSYDSGMPHYVIRPGDVLSIVVWKEPEMSGTVKVRLDGRITMPLLGDINAFRRSPTELGSEIASRLTRFIDAPQVTIAVSEALSARFFIIGEVNKPGVYQLEHQTTILQSIALAGGFGQFAKRNKVVIFRGMDGTEGYVVVNFDELAAGDLKQNYVLQPGDTILVP